jgi:hypothetical protein
MTSQAIGSHFTIASSLSPSWPLWSRHVCRYYSPASDINKILLLLYFILEIDEKWADD